jgi:hypothetical protein
MGLKGGRHAGDNRELGQGDAVGVEEQCRPGASGKNDLCAAHGARLSHDGGDVASRGYKAMHGAALVYNHACSQSGAGENWHGGEGLQPARPMECGARPPSHWRWAAGRRSLGATAGRCRRHMDGRGRASGRSLVHAPYRKWQGALRHYCITVELPCWSIDQAFKARSSVPFVTCL